MSDYLQLACRRLGITGAEVLDHKVYDLEIVLVLVRGPKHRIPLAELTTPELQTPVSLEETEDTGESEVLEEPNDVPESPPSESEEPPEQPPQKRRGRKS
jgi:hypothetical protein